MLTLFRAGGFPMFFLLAFGLLALICAARFAWAPTGRGLRTTVSLGVATTFTTLTSICADLAKVGYYVPDYLRAHPDDWQILLQGAAESLSPAIFGFTLMSLTALLVALGMHREVRE